MGLLYFITAFVPVPLRSYLHFLNSDSVFSDIWSALDNSRLYCCFSLPWDDKSGCITDVGLAEFDRMTTKGLREARAFFSEMTSMLKPEVDDI